MNTSEREEPYPQLPEDPGADDDDASPDKPADEEPVVDDDEPEGGHTYNE
jgi:hypothetical protein